MHAMLACQRYLRLRAFPCRWSSENVRVFRTIRIDRDDGDRRMHPPSQLWGQDERARGGGAIYLKERAFTLLSGET